jgi:hypothetical protein
MKYEKIAQTGIDRTYQSSLHFIEERNTRFSNCESIDGEVWCVKDPGVPICSAGKSKQRTSCDSGNFCCFYCQTAAQSDRPGQKFCKFQRNFDQQSGQNSIGRFSFKKGSWPKNRGKLKYPIAMIDCGSKSFHRYTIFLSLARITISPIIILNH